MNPLLPDPRLDLPAEPERPVPAALPLGARLAARFDRAVDRDTIERLVVALALDPRGAACTRAWLVVWNVRRALLEGWRCGESADLALAEEGTIPARAESEAQSAFRRFEVAPTRLDGAAAAAWGRSAPDPLDPADAPWRDAPVVAASIRVAGRPWGLLVGEGTDAEALEALASLTGRALERCDADVTARWRARQAAAVAEVVRAAVSAHNLAEVLRLVTQQAAQATGSRGSALWLATTSERRARLEVTHGPPGSRERIAHVLMPLATDVIERPRLRLVDPVTDEPLLSPDAAAQLSTLALVPLVAYGRTLGVLSVYDRMGSHPGDAGGYDPGDAEFLASLADAAAVAIDQAARFEAQEHAAQANRELAERLRREERLAAFGESALRLCRDGRSPLASIGAFARRVHRALAEDDANRDYLEIVIREAERLERMLGEQLDYATPEAPRLRVESLNAVIQDVLGGVGETLVRRRIRLLKKLSPDVPALLLDAARLRRVVGNVLESALESAATGGRIRVETRRAQQHAIVEIAHDGGALPGTLLDQLFVPFASGRHGGPAVGLGVAQQIVREHGGEIRVRSEGEWNTIFSFTLPILENRDRRGAGANRRGARQDRRTLTER